MRSRHGRRATARRSPHVLLVYDSALADRYATLVRAPRDRVTIHVASKPEEATGVIADADIIYAWKLPASLYRDARRLSWLQAAGAGVDWALVPELPAHVMVTRAPGVFGPWMAEYVIGWSLWVTQRGAEYHEAQRQGRWAAELLPDRLSGKTLTIVGLGDIGRTIARRASALGMRVIGVSRSGRRVAGVTKNHRLPGLGRALGEADFVVLTVPLTPETRGLIGARELRAMPPTAWLMNIARGEVVDERALLDALEQRRIAGAILDVFAAEPLPNDHPLWRAPNVVITPHIAGPSIPEEITPVFNENLARFLSGRRLRHVVDRARGY